METIKMPGKWKIEISLFFIHALFYFSLPFPVSSPTCHFNGAISRADNSTTRTHTCFYKPTLHLSCFSKIKMTLKSFCIIQRTCFAFWFWLHVGKLPSPNTTFTATLQLFTDTMIGRVSCPPKWECLASSSYLLCMETRGTLNPLEMRKRKLNPLKYRANPSKMTISTDGKTKQKKNED